MVRESVVDWSGAVGKPLYHADQTVADRMRGARSDASSQRVH